MTILERRRIEAEILKPVYEELCAEFGKEVAQRVVGRAVKKAAVALGASLSAAEEANMDAFASHLPKWMEGDALQIRVIQKTPYVLDYDVVRCRYAEMYRELGLEEIGHLLSCNRDGSVCEGYSADLELTRTQTIMEGCSHCDFRYRWRG
jgi:L-2-amino-thiazoline-4-carboxylic acid hydrolase-like protein